MDHGHRQLVALDQHFYSGAHPCQHVSEIAGLFRFRDVYDVLRHRGHYICCSSSPSISSADKQFATLYMCARGQSDVLHARFGLGGDVLEPYKKIIERWLWPDVLRSQDTSVSQAKRGRL
jgi:hypothetical protein